MKKARSRSSNHTNAIDIDLQWARRSQIVTDGRTDGGSWKQAAWSRPSATNEEYRRKDRSLKSRMDITARRDTWRIVVPGTQVSNGTEHRHTDELRASGRSAQSVSNLIYVVIQGAGAR